MVRAALSIVAAAALAAVCLQLGASAQSAERGTITGRVTADQGVVHAFRVAAHNLDRRLWYTVFTNRGQFTVPQALPGRYELTVVEPGYESPKVSVELGAGDSKAADLSLRKRAAEPERTLARGDEGPQARTSQSARTQYFNSLEELYPAAPARDLLREHCIGCHRDDFGSMHLTRDAFVRGIEKMTETGPANNHFSLALGRTPISRPQKVMLAEYLEKHFGPGLPDKKLKEEPLVFDEAVAGKAIYVSYDIPDDLPFPSMGNQIGGNMVDGAIPQLAPETRHHLQAAAISPVDGRVWYSSRASASSTPSRAGRFATRCRRRRARCCRWWSTRIRTSASASSGAPSSAGWKPRRAGCTCIRRRRPTTASTGSTSIATATCGAPAGRRAPSASGTQRPKR
jgi:hypothetical protein